MRGGGIASAPLKVPPRNNEKPFTMWEHDKDTHGDRSYDGDAENGESDDDTDPCWFTAGTGGRRLDYDADASSDEDEKEHHAWNALDDAAPPAVHQLREQRRASFFLGNFPPITRVEVHTPVDPTTTLPTTTELFLDHESGRVLVEDSAGRCYWRPQRTHRRAGTRTSRMAQRRGTRTLQARKANPTRKKSKGAINVNMPASENASREEEGEDDSAFVFNFVIGAKEEEDAVNPYSDDSSLISEADEEMLAKLGGSQGSEKYIQKVLSGQATATTDPGGVVEHDYPLPAHFNRLALEKAKLQKRNNPTKSRSSERTPAAGTSYGAHDLLRFPRFVEQWAIHGDCLEQNHTISVTEAPFEQCCGVVASSPLRCEKCGIFVRRRWPPPKEKAEGVQQQQ